MELADIIPPNGVLPILKVNSKKQMLQELSEVGATLTGQDERVIFDTLIQRERLGSTGVGGGVAIPHGKFPGLQNIVGIFARLSKPIPFDAMDDLPVDLVCVLLAPEGSGADHLKALSRIARLMRSSETVAALRSLPDRDSLYELLTEGPRASAA